MSLFFDFFLIILATIIVVRSTRLIVRYASQSLSDYAILLLYIFQIIPVICDLIFGIPVYKSWYSGFTNSMSNDSVCILYDVYVGMLFLGLFRVSKTAKVNERVIDCKFDYVCDDSRSIWASAQKIPSSILILVTISPLVHTFITGNAAKMIVYGSFNSRGLSSSFTAINSFLIILSILALMTWYFKKESSVLRVLVFCLLSLLIIWINGKRYVIITIMFSYLYIYVMERKNKRKKTNIKVMISMMAIVVILFSVYYITSVKILSDGSFAETYASLRIDFGRDDVVKYVLWKEFFQGEHILDYPFQSVLSTIFMIIPRSIYPTKGYPHYRYLTASLYNTTVLDIPAGMTPSLLEMMIANFRILGIPICILFLCWYCKKADRARTNWQRYCYAMVLMGMLSQSLDSMILLFYMVLFFLFFGKYRFVFGSGSR